MPLVPWAILPLVCWALLWSRNSYWNPFFFAGLWLGAAMVMYLASQSGYPGIRRHAIYSALSVPLWWWFELVNSRVGNWEYIGDERYTQLEYFLMASIAFSTVVPALDAAWGLTIRDRDVGLSIFGRRPAAEKWIQVAVGMGLQIGVFAQPAWFFPFVWVAPFLILDGLVAYRGGRSLVSDLLDGKWRLAAQIAAGGLLCGFLWEFWNYWATPKWVYDIPLLDFGRLFEMPILGYAGYVPFAWSVYQLLQLNPLEKILLRPPGAREPSGTAV